MTEPMTDAERPWFSLEDKAAAWDWLRDLAVKRRHHHAAVAVVEWQAFFNALTAIANADHDDARRLKFMAADALTHSQRMAPAPATGLAQGDSVPAASIPD